MVGDQTPCRRAAVYARVSTAEQAQGSSLPEQVVTCRAHIVAAGFAEAGVFVDEGVSGAKASRPGLDALMAAVRSGDIDVIVVAHLDRAGRSMRHLGELMGELDERGVALVSVAESFDSSSPSGRLQRNILASFAEFERQTIAERVTTGTEAALAAGQWPGSYAPYGYATGPPGNRLRLVPSEADTLRRIIDLFVEEELSTPKIAAALNAEGRRPRHGERFNARIVRWLLCNHEHLCGRFTWRRPELGYGRDPVVVDGPALIDEATRDKLRRRLAATTNPRRPDNHDYLLSGRITSPHGSTMYGLTNRVAPLYRCSDFFSGNASEDGRTCSCRTVRAEIVEDAVWAEIVSLLCDPARLAALAGVALERTTQAAAHDAGKLAALDRRIAALERAAGDKLSRLLAEGLDPMVAAEAAKELTDRLTAARARREQVAAWLHANQADVERAGALMAMVELALSMLPEADRPTKRRVIELLDIRVTVTGWNRCTYCDGKGLLPNPARPAKRRRNIGADRLAAVICPTCHRHRWFPKLEITGVVPQGDLEIPAPAGNSERWPFRVVPGT